MKSFYNHLSFIALTSLLTLGCDYNLEVSEDALGSDTPAVDDNLEPIIGPVAPTIPASLEQKSLLPAWETADEKLAASRAPKPYATNISSPPTGNILAPAEYAHMEGVVVHVPFYNSTQNFFGEMVNAIAEAGATPHLLVADSREADSVKNYFLTPYGTSSSQVNFLYMNNDAFWTRDFGPWHVYVNGSRVIVNNEYYYNRQNDNMVPTRLGYEWNENVYSTGFSTEGGNFMTDGLGTCWASTGVFEYNNISTSQATAVFKNYLGCDNVKFVAPLPREGTTHIDMFSKILNQDTIMVAYSSSSWGAYSTQIAHLNSVAADYASTPKPGGGSWNIVRIPMQISNNDGVFYAYTNSLILNKTVIVPIYGLSTDAEALQVYEEAMPGYQIVGVRAEDVIPMGGSVHCTTMQVPVENYKSCGDGVVLGSEECDFYLAGQSCISLGYAGGTLSCNTNCTFNTNGCQGENDNPTDDDPTDDDPIDDDPIDDNPDSVVVEENGVIAKDAYDIIKTNSGESFHQASNGNFSVSMSGDNDADLYVWKNVSSPTWSNFSCRPYIDGSNESCELDGPGDFLVVVKGYAPTSNYRISVTYTQ